MDNQELAAGAGVTAKLTNIGEGLAPLTVAEPDGGLAVYPVTDPTVNAYVPFGSVKVITRRRTD